MANFWLTRSALMDYFYYRTLREEIMRKKRVRMALFCTVFVLMLGLGMLWYIFVDHIFLIYRSMEPNLHPWDYCIYETFTPRFLKVRRGNIIVIDNSDNGLFWRDMSTGQLYPMRSIKRVIGLPGEEIIGRSNVLFVRSPNGHLTKIVEEYNLLGPVRNFRMRMGRNEYFVMGDNRKISLDSRRLGSIKGQNIVGVIRAVF